MESFPGSSPCAGILKEYGDEHCSGTCKYQEKEQVAVKRGESGTAVELETQVEQSRRRQEPAGTLLPDFVFVGAAAVVAAAVAAVLLAFVVWQQRRRSAATSGDDSSGGGSDAALASVPAAASV